MIAEQNEHEHESNKIEKKMLRIMDLSIEMV